MPDGGAFVENRILAGAACDRLRSDRRFGPTKNLAKSRRALCSRGGRFRRIHFVGWKRRAAPTDDARTQPHRDRRSEDTEIMGIELKALRARVWAARGIALRVLFAIVLLLVTVLVAERVLEARAVTRLTATEKFANVNGAEIRYRVLGDNPRASTVVFLTGLGGSV